VTLEEVTIISNPTDKRLDIFAALIRRGWHQTEVTRFESTIKTSKSFLFGTKYR